MDAQPRIPAPRGRPVGSGMTEHHTRRPEYRAAASARMKARWQDPEYRAARLADLAERAKTPEYREMMRRASECAGRATRLPPMSREQHRLYKKCKRYGCSRADSLKAAGVRA